MKLRAKMSGMCDMMIDQVSPEVDELEERETYPGQ
jgi:hypothetical protein